VVPNDLGCGHVLFVLRCMRVGDQNDRVAKRQRPTSSCVYTVLCVHSTNYKVRHGMLLEDLRQRRAME